jgi:hypothetical protein
MKYASVAGLVFAILSAGAASATAVVPTHVYDLDNSLTDAKGGPSLTLVNGATLGATGVTFTAGEGLALTGAAFASQTAYSIALDFRFDSLPTKFSRILNSSSNNGISRPDDGLYVHYGDGQPVPVMDYYSVGAAYDGGPEFTIGANSLHHILFARDEGATSVYLDGVSVLNLTSVASSVMGSSLLFFIDDGAEQAPGFVSAICTYDGKVGASDAAMIGGGACSAAFSGGANAVPEPASWAMMIGGFALTGAAMRRRRFRATVGPTSTRV